MVYCNVINNEIVSAPRPLPTDITEETAIQNNWYPVVFLNMPHHLDAECNIVTQLIELQLGLDGELVKAWYEVVNKSPEQIQTTSQTLLTILRQERNKKLLETDWTQLPNAYNLTESDKVLWETYRQELRDFTSTVDLSNIVWPVPPNAL